MIWGSMSGDGVEKLHFIDGLLDDKGYIDIRKVNAQTSAENLIFVMVLCFTRTTQSINPEMLKIGCSKIAQKHFVRLLNLPTLIS